MNKQEVYVVKTDSGEIMSVYKSEGRARRLCKDNGYNYEACLFIPEQTKAKTAEDSARALYIKKYGADSSNIHRTVYIDGFTDGLDSIDSRLIINILEYFDRGLSDVAEGSGERQPMHSEIKEALSNLRSQPPISIFHKNQSHIANLEAQNKELREDLEKIMEVMLNTIHNGKDTGPYKIARKAVYGEE